MEKTDNTQVHTLQLRIDWNGGAEKEPLRHANQLLILTQDHEMFLSFFHLSPPILLGDADEKIAQLTGRDSILPECVARLNITPRFAKQVIKALETQLRAYEESDGEPS